MGDMGDRGGWHLSGDQVVALVQALPTLLGSLIALIAAVKAGRRADEAQKSAEMAHARATDAVREQINFALANAARRGGILPGGILAAGAGKEATE